MTDARTLTLALGGKWYRRYGLACCPAHGDRKPSLTLADAPDGKLLLNCKAGCSFIDVLTALRDRGLLDRHARPRAPDPAELARRRAEDEAEAAKRERQALACWNEAIPVHGTPAETYLRGRGITCDLPESLRFHSECWHGATAKRLPAMIARVDGLSRLAVHRTYLRPDGTGKADVDPNKAMLGSVMGGAVAVCKADGPLVVAEGIETALSLSSGLLRSPATVWAALSAPGVAGLRLPDRPHRLTIAPDGDPAGHASAHKLAERATALGWRVSILPAPEGKDWNDILVKKGAVA
ncbi:MAG: toprim domain-containing protein [Paracoccus sp. (in: a-proteobacteria)]|nr:toprim domain-containing protein [Paracoccus sp. (in: a-proteobacteria)]